MSFLFRSSNSTSVLSTICSLRSRCGPNGMTAWASLRSRRPCVPLTYRLTVQRAWKHTRTEENHELEEVESSGAIEDLDLPDIELGGSNHDGVRKSTQTFDHDGIEQHESDEGGWSAGNGHPTFTKAFTKIEGDARTHRLRKHGKTPIPLSPVIDSVFASNRVKWKLKKASPPNFEEMTPFQKRLNANPFAHALATPVRTAVSTLSRLPRFFHFALDLQQSPLPPQNLTLVPSRLWAASAPEGYKNLKTRGPQMYVDLLKAQTDLFATRTSILVNNLKYAYGATLSKDARSRVVVRKNLSGFVLKSLRLAAARRLAWGFKNPKAGLVVRCDDGAHTASNIRNVACVIYVGSMHTQRYEAVHQEMIKLITRFNGFSEHVRKAQGLMYGTARNNNTPLAPKLSPLMNLEVYFPASHSPLVNNAEGRAVPVYSLMDLLGTETTEELLRGTQSETAKCFALIEDARNTKPQMDLMKIENFLAVNMSWNTQTDWKYEQHDKDARKASD